MKPAYRILSLLTMIRAIMRGPSAFFWNRVNASAHKDLARAMRRLRR